MSDISPTPSPSSSSSPPSSPLPKKSFEAPQNLPKPVPIEPDNPSFYAEDVDWSFSVASKETPSLAPLLWRERQHFEAIPDSELGSVSIRRLRRYWHLRHCVFQESVQLGHLQTLNALLQSFQVISSGSSSKLSKLSLTLSKSKGKPYSTITPEQRRYCARILDLDWINPCGETALWLSAAASSPCFMVLIQSGAPRPPPATVQTTPCILHAATILTAFGDSKVLSWLLQNTSLKAD